MPKLSFKKLINLLIPILIAIFNIVILMFPQEIIKASKDGLLLWVNNVIPSLLPFIIGTNILTKLGAINFIGTFLEPIMYPLFRIPGSGGFALITGMTSGYPMGAKVISDMRINKTITKIEAQRLVSFCNNSGPLFILGAVGIGIFKNPNVGYFLMIIHYLAAILNGFIFRYYKRNSNTKISYVRTTNLPYRAYQAMCRHRQIENKSFGHILGESINNSMQSILQIGGFIILFCVLVEIAKVTQLLNFLVLLFTPIITKFNIDINIVQGFLIGLLEVTNGANILGAEEFSKLQVLSVAAIVSFGGISIHAQSINFLSKTDINIYLYIISKLIHTINTVILGLIIYPIFNFKISSTITAYNPNYFNKLDAFVFSTTIFTFSIIITFVISIFLNIILHIKTKKDF